MDEEFFFFFSCSKKSPFVKIRRLSTCLDNVKTSLFFNIAYTYIKIQLQYYYRFPISNTAKNPHQLWSLNWPINCSNVKKIIFQQITLEMMRIVFTFRRRIRKLEKNWYNFSSPLVLMTHSIRIPGPWLITMQIRIHETVNRVRQTKITRNDKNTHWSKITVPKIIISRFVSEMFVM